MHKRVNQFLSSFLCGYREGFSAQTDLVWLMEILKHHFDKNGFAGNVQMDLLKGTLMQF